MKSNLLVGASVIALGLAMSPAFADVDVSADDTANGNGILNDTQTDIGGDATNSPQTGIGNTGGDVNSNNGLSVDALNDNDGNGIGNDTFQNSSDATNAPQTGIGNAGDDIASNNTLTDSSEDNDTVDINLSETTDASGSSAAANDGGVALDDSGNGNFSGNFSGNSDDDFNDNTVASDNSDNDVNGASGSETAAAAQNGSFALAIDDISIEVQTDVVASNTELNAYNVLNIGSGNAIYADESSAELTADATISGGATDSVMVQMSANSGANAITQQSQTITANIDNLTVN